MTSGEVFLDLLGISQMFGGIPGWWVSLHGGGKTHQSKEQRGFSHGTEDITGKKGGQSRGSLCLWEWQNFGKAC